jgi:hypothetical protein
MIIKNIVQMYFLNFIFLLLIFPLTVNAACVFNCPVTDNNQTELLSENTGIRYYDDQPDVNNDYQIHFIYMLDKDGKDNQWDVNGKMQTELEELNEEMFRLTGYKQKYKFDYREDGKLDITFIRLDRKGVSARVE